MHPTLFEIHSEYIHLDIKSYPFFLVLAGAVVIIGSLYFAKKRGLPLRSTLVILLAMFLSVFIGARLLHIFLNLGFYQNNPERFLAIDTQGFSLFGGILLASLVGYICSGILAIQVWKLSDTVAPFLGIGIALVRVGCFLNGCCFGGSTQLPWGVTFPFLSPAHKYQLAQQSSEFFLVEPVHPTQLYEIIAAIIGSIISFYIIKKKAPDGLAFLAFGIWFTAFRWINSNWRVSPATFEASSFFYPSFYFFIIVVCLFFFGKIIRRMRV